MQENYLENKIKNLPDFDADDKFVSKLYGNLNLNNKGNKFCNLFLKFSVFTFVFVCILNSFLIINDRKNEIKSEVIIEIPLEEKTTVESENNSLFVYDIVNQTDYLAIDYQIVDGKLKFELDPGVYKITFVSNKYNSVSIAEVYNQ